MAETQQVMPDFIPDSAVQMPDFIPDHAVASSPPGERLLQTQPFYLEHYLSPLLGKPGERSILGKAIYGEEATPQSPDYGRGWNLPLLRPSAMVKGNDIPILSGILKGGAQLGEELLTPANFSILGGAGVLSKTPGLLGEGLSRLLSSGFSLQMLNGAIQQSPEILHALKKGDWNEAARLTTHVLGGIGLAAAAGGHGLGAEVPETAPVQQQAAPTATQMEKPTNLIDRPLEPPKEFDPYAPIADTSEALKHPVEMPKKILSREEVSPPPPDADQILNDQKLAEARANSPTDFEPYSELPQRGAAPEPPRDLSERQAILDRLKPLLGGEEGRFHIGSEQPKENILDLYKPSDKTVTLNLSRRLNPRAPVTTEDLKAPREPLNKTTILEDSDGKVYLGPLTPELWLQKANDNLKTIKDWSEARNWYKDLFSEFRKHTNSDEEAQNKLLAWAASQQQASPSKGMQDVMRAGDVVSGLPEIKRAGLGADRLSAILKGESIASGFGAKLYDFMDAVTRKKTRTWMGNNPEGGAPAPIDVHAARDIGFVDQTTIDRVKERFGQKAASKLKMDIPGAPGEYQTEYGNRYYQNIADFLNEHRFRGGNWTPEEAQAVGWVSTLKQFGLPVEGPKEIFSKNVRRISYEVSFGEGSPYSKEFPPLYELPPERAKAITDTVGNFIADLVTKETGSRIVNRVNEAGGYLHYPVQPSIQLDVLDSPETVRDVADAIGYLGQQSEMMISRTLSPTSKGIARPSDFSVDILPQKVDAFRDGKALQDFWNEIQSKLPDKIKGFAPYVNKGKLGIRIIDRDRAWKTADLQSEGELINAINEAAIKQGIKIRISPSRAEFEFPGNDWTSDSEGGKYLQSLRSRGRTDLAQRLVDTYRSTVRDRLAQAYRETEHLKEVAKPAYQFTETNPAKAAEVKEKFFGQMRTENRFPETSPEQVAEELKRTGVYSGTKSYHTEQRYQETPPLTEVGLRDVTNRIQQNKPWTGLITRSPTVGKVSPDALTTIRNIQDLTMAIPESGTGPIHFHEVDPGRTIQGSPTPETPAGVRAALIQHLVKYPKSKGPQPSDARWNVIHKGTTITPGNRR